MSPDLKSNPLFGGKRKNSRQLARGGKTYIRQPAGRRQSEENTPEYTERRRRTVAERTESRSRAIERRPGGTGRTSADSTGQGRTRQSQAAARRRTVASVGRGSGQADLSASRIARRREARRKREEQGRWIIFGCVMVVYCVILFIGMLCVMGYTRRSLKKYENSQSIYAMQDYFDVYQAAVEEGKIPEGVDLSAYDSDYYTDGYVENEFLRQLQGKTLSFEKDPACYDTENPVYLIKADDSLVSTVTWEGYDGQTIFGILTILKWKITSVETAFTNPEGDAGTAASAKQRELQSYSFTVPQGYHVYVNRMLLDDVELTDETVAVAAFENAKDYVNLNGLLVYRLTDIGCPIHVTITDLDGVPVSYTQTGNDYYVGYTASNDMPEDLMNLALTAAESWQLMMTNDRSFEAVAPYLIAGSYYYNMGYEFATGVDITFMSPHTLKDPAITDVAVTDYIRYSDTCFACHVQFNVNMTLTVTGQDAVNAMDSTFLFIYYDDSDDGVDNPHWGMIDMIEE